MTVNTTSNQTILQGNGATTAFSFSFPGVGSSDISVTYIDATGKYNLLATSAYTLTLNAPAGGIWGLGGTVTYNPGGTPIPSGASLLIQRILPFTQNTSISNQGAAYPQVTESALDILEMQIQQLASRTGLFRGIWQVDTFYNLGDVTIDGISGANTGNYYQCGQANTSTTWTADLASGYWTKEIDVFSINANVALAEAAAVTATTQAGLASTSASSASGSASTAVTEAGIATTQAGIATTQAGIATTQASDASNSAAAAAIYATALSATSTTSIAIGTGAQTLTIQASKQIIAGQFLQIASNANAANYMHGSVTSYDNVAGTLVMNITDIGGSGTHADWNVSISGTQGTQGPVGPAGPGGTVTTTGTPTTGSLTKFSGATSIANADLTGAVRTSGGMATSLYGAQVVSGSMQANVTALTSSSNSVAIDFSANNDFSLTLTENTTLANPTNITVGQSGSIMITNGSGPYTVAYGGYWKFPGGTVPTVTATNGARDTLFYHVRSATFIEANLVKGFA